MTDTHPNLESSGSSTRQVCAPAPISFIAEMLDIAATTSAWNAHTVERHVWLLPLMRGIWNPSGWDRALRRIGPHTYSADTDDGPVAAAPLPARPSTDSGRLLRVSSAARKWIGME